MKENLWIDDNGAHEAFEPLAVVEEDIYMNLVSLKISWVQIRFLFCLTSDDYVNSADHLLDIVAEESDSELGSKF